MTQWRFLLLCLLTVCPHVHSADCNGNGLEDSVEITAGTLTDCDDDGVPDICQLSPLPFTAPESLLVPGPARNPLVADFDGDGTRDLAVGFFGGLSLRRVEPLTGYADAPETIYEVPGRSSEWHTGDVDGDGDLDVATLDTDAAWILSNRGDGTFDGPRALDLGDGSSSMRLHDLDSDGAADLIVAYRGTDLLRSWRSNSDGTFIGPVELPVGDSPEAIVVTDLDGDGLPDIATANRLSGDVSLLLQTADGDFAAAKSLPAGKDNLWCLAAADFDDDGRGDLVVLAASAVCILRNRGGGDFDVPHVVLHEGGRVMALDTGDIDRDGDVDAVAAFLGASPRVTAFRGGGDGTIVAATPVSNDLAVGTVTIADLQDDGLEDLLLVVFQQSSVTVLDGLSTAPPQRVAFQPPVTVRTVGDPHTAVLADFDRDDDLDLVTGNNNEGLSLYRNDGMAGFGAPEDSHQGPVFFSVDAGDVDHDGDLDLISASFEIRVQLNDGAGNFSHPVTYENGVRNFHVRVADLDGDGWLDILSVNESVNTVTLMRNRQDGTYEKLDELPVGAQPIAVAPGDFDGDGDVDFAIASRLAAELDIFLNRGDGTFTEPQVFALRSSPSYVVADDFDGDGDSDLVTANESASSVTLFWAESGARFVQGASFVVHEKPYSLITVDLDQDGARDVVTISEEGNSMSPLVNRDRREFALGSVLPTGLGPRFCVGGDLDGDGDDDLLSANRLSRTLTVYRNDSESLQPVDYLIEVCSEAAFHEISAPSSGTGSSRRVGKYVLAARGDDAQSLSVAFQNVNRFQLHEDFLASAFSDRFPEPPVGEEYDRLVARRATRDYYVGALFQVPAQQGFLYAFTIVADTGFDPREALTLEEVTDVHARLSMTFGAGELAYRPDSQAAQDAATAWLNPPFAISLTEERTDLVYEPYTLAIGYGRVRLLDLEAFEEANRSGLFTFQDILVLDDAPADIEGVVGGVITGKIQGDLSHIAVRTARRGTPNAFVAGAREAFAPLDGRLVRLEVLPADYVVEEVAPEEAEEFWASSRPRLTDLPTFDADYRALDHLLEMDVSPAGASTAVARFGGKATNLARLQSLLTGPFEQYREEGFGIPVAYYVDFMRENLRPLAGVDVTYDQYVTHILEDTEVQSDSRRRFEALEEFRDFARDNGVVDPELVAALRSRIETVFEGTTTAVRFRSSSNVEDALEFNGAGLYESTSVCVADGLDEDDDGPSLCDPGQANERTIERALKKVWTSVWTFRAHEERTFFQIPPERVAMGILVNRAFLDEVANGVAFTGNPRNATDRRYLITAQIGEESVVSPQPGTTVERDLLEIEAGEVTAIVRDRASSLVEVGTQVVSDAKLSELGAFMAHVDATFPLDLQGQSRELVLLDFEFKVERGGELAVKQVRPFLIPSTLPSAPTFEWIIPEDTVVCGVFSKERTGREPRVEYETKSTLRLMPQSIELPGGSDTFRGNIVDELLFGPQQDRAEPLADGTFSTIRIPDAGNETIYRFRYDQDFELPTGERFAISIPRLDFRGRGELAVEESRTLDEEFITFELTLQGALDGRPVVSYSSCTYELLPRWEVSLRTEDETSLELVERFLPSPNLVDTGPANLMQAVVDIAGSRQVIDSYWDLTYAARRHNQNVRYWIVLDSAVEFPALPRPVALLEVTLPEPPALPAAQIAYLDSDLNVLSEVAGVSERRESSTEPPSFLRGDTNGDGTRNLLDALVTLEFVFSRGSAPSCLKAADANDDGRINVVDPLVFLETVFGRRGELPSPFAACGSDPTEDRLSCGVFPACP